MKSVRIAAARCLLIEIGLIEDEQINETIRQFYPDADEDLLKAEIDRMKSRLAEMLMGGEI